MSPHPDPPSASDPRSVPVSVSVVVPCTRPHLLTGLADALALQVDEVDATVELIAAGDVADLDGTAWALPTILVPTAERHPNHRRNAALERAGGTVLAFLDDDAVPEPGWLATASSIDPGAVEVWTGPERPTRDSPQARMAHALACSWWSEGTRAHVDPTDHDVGWSDVPFCNLVTTRALLDRAGPPSEDVPWDADDFEWCHRARGVGARFRNRPDLAIRHDRYPDRATDWLRRKARERRRTGEKLVSHPHLYARVPGVVAAAVAPLVAAPALVAMPRRARVRALALGAGGYLGLVAVVADAAATRVDLSHPPRARAAATLVALHLATVPALHVGAVLGLVRRGREPHGREAGTVS